MKVFVRNKPYQEAIKKIFAQRITLVEDRNAAEWIIGGRFHDEDYHSKLKGVIVPYTGLDAIDLAAAKRRKIVLYNTTVHSEYVAEKAVQLMFALLGNVVPYHNRLALGDWSYRNGSDRVPWISLINQKIGIYGYGRIGQAIHQFLRPFNVDVSVIDRQKTYRDVTLVKTLKELIEHANIIFIATPLTKATEHTFDEEHFSFMKGKYLINVGRGSIIDEEALYHALKNKSLKGFASDVWFRYPRNDEPLTPSNYRLESFDNVVMSPHCGGFSTDAPKALMLKVMDYLEQILENDYSEALDLEKL